MLMSVYRDKMDFINYSTAGGGSRAVHNFLFVISLCCAAMTGGLFRARAGLKPAVGGSVLGLLLRYKYSDCEVVKSQQININLIYVSSTPTHDSLVGFTWPVKA